MNIATKEDWWNALNDHWNPICDIIFHSIQSDALAYEIPGDKESQPTGRTCLLELEHLRNTRDACLIRYLSAAWSMSSDTYAWSVPSWDVFCDLCSESGVLEDD